MQKCQVILNISYSRSAGSKKKLGSLISQIPEIRRKLQLNQETKKSSGVVAHIIRLEAFSLYLLKMFCCVSTEQKDNL